MTGVVRFRTESGSLYELNYDAKTWARLDHDPARSPLLRTEEGTLENEPHLEVGKSAVLFGPPLLYKKGTRMILTSTVVEIVPLQP